jgi:hypothetical protein
MARLERACWSPDWAARVSRAQARSSLSPSEERAPVAWRPERRVPHERPHWQATAQWPMGAVRQPSALCPLVMAQGDERVDPGGATGWEQARRERDQDEEHRHDRRCCEVAGTRV